MDNSIPELNTIIIDPYANSELAAWNFYCRVKRPPFESLKPESVAEYYSELPETQRRQITAAINCLLWSLDSDQEVQPHLEAIAKVWVKHQPPYYGEPV